MKKLALIIGLLISTNSFAASSKLGPEVAHIDCSKKNDNARGSQATANIENTATKKKQDNVQI